MHAVPKELTCPITQELLIDPVLAEDGHTYERAAITRWFSTGNTRSPVTNEELEGKKLISNHVLKKACESASLIARREASISL